MKFIFLLLASLCSFSLFGQTDKPEKPSLEKFIRDSKAIVAKEREFRDNAGNKEVVSAPKQVKSVTEAYCENVVGTDNLIKEMNKTLGYDPGFGDRLKTQDLVLAQCRSILEDIKNEREQRDNFERSRSADVYRTFQRGGNIEQEASKNSSKPLMIGIPSSIVSTAVKTGQGAYHFFTFDPSRHQLYILEPKSHRINAVIPTGFKGNLPSAFAEAYADFTVIYKNEFTKCFNAVPKIGIGDGKLSVFLRPGIYIVIAINPEQTNFVTSNIAVYTDVELNYLVHINKPKIIIDTDTQKKGKTSYELVDENGNPIKRNNK